MGGDSIARGLRVSLVGLTLTLLAVAALGVAGLYGARVDYEDALARTYELETAAARLRTAALAEQTARASAPEGASPASRSATMAFEAEADVALALASTDAASRGLVIEAVSLQRRIRDLGPARSAAVAAVRSDIRTALNRDAAEVTSDLVSRQGARRQEARAEAAADTRVAAGTTVAAALLALLAALFLVRDFMRSVRRPLDNLVAATKRLAAGDLPEGVPTQGPLELRELSEAFNVMAADLRTARTRLEGERRRLAVTIESLGDGLAVCDASGRLAAFNPRAATLLPGLRLGEPLDPEGGVLPPVAEAIDGETMIEAGGRTLAVTAASLEGDESETVWTIRDVSERVRLERMKSDFVAAASHELRTPLTSIKGFAELLDRSEGLSTKQRDAVEVIRLSTERLVSLVEDLLEVARLEAGRVTIDPEPLDLLEVVEEACRLLDPRMVAKGQRLEVVPASGLPRVHADARRVRDIVENLLTNAHLYTGEGGRVEVSFDATDDEVLMAVSDNGRGLTTEELEHVFDRFYRGHRAGTLVPGTGLGLWIVQSVAKLHGGSVAVESEAGRGSRFTVRLPRARVPAEAPGGVAQVRAG